MLEWESRRFQNKNTFYIGAFHYLHTHLGEGGGVSNLIYISIAYYMQKGGRGGGVQKACKNV